MCDRDRVITISDDDEATAEPAEAAAAPTEATAAPTELHMLAEYADGRWVLAMLLGLAAFWGGVAWLIWRWVT
jgi:hypothetical protein